jgi:hypothetical protein
VLGVIRSDSIDITPMAGRSFHVPPHTHEQSHCHRNDHCCTDSQDEEPPKHPHNNLRIADEKRANCAAVNVGKKL